MSTGSDISTLFAMVSASLMYRLLNRMSEVSLANLESLMILSIAMSFGGGAFLRCTIINIQEITTYD